jgi:hypothetical protein
MNMNKERKENGIYSDMISIVITNQQVDMDLGQGKTVKNKS